MKSKDPKKQEPGRYTAAHLGTLQKLYMYTQFCDWAGLGSVTTETVRIMDTEIELKTRIRRNCIVDLLRDGFLIPPEVIIPRGDKLYTISDRCMDVVEVVPDEVEGSLELGMCFDRNVVNHVSLSRIMGFWNMMMVGDCVLEKYELGGVWFYRVVCEIQTQANDSSSDEVADSAEKFSGERSAIGEDSPKTRGVRDPLEPDSSSLSSK
jgi:hypothetical protein